MAQYHEGMAQASYDQREVARWLTQRSEVREASEKSLCTKCVIYIVVKKHIADFDGCNRWID